jgi:hypothetical protein
LAPKDCFIPAEAIERVTGQIGQTQKATCKVDGGINALPPRAGQGLRSICSAERCSIEIGIGRISAPEPCIDNFPRRLLGLAALSVLTQMVGLYFEQTGFHCRGAPQSPQQTGSPQHQLPLYGRLGVVIRNNSRLEIVVIFRILQRTDYRLGCEAVANGIAAGTLLAFLGNWTSAFARIAPVGLDLPERSH